MAIARLRELVAGMTRLVEARGNTEAAALEPAHALLADLVAHDDWLPEVCATPNVQGYRQYLLYGDPLDRFSLVSFVWGPGQCTPVHDHGMWGLVGMLRGAEAATPYSRRPDGSLHAGTPVTLHPGMVEAVSPIEGDIHRVANALPDRVSVSIHLYGGNIGTIRRRAFDPVSSTPRPFVSGYSGAVVPNLWS